MQRISRRLFLASSAALGVSCAWRGTQPGDARPVRAPAVGQSWRYAKLSGYSGKLIGHQTDRIASVAASIEIESRAEPLEHPSGSRAGAWLAKELGIPKRPEVPLNEVQQPWGRILVDPHWAEVQAYDAAIPLWPVQLRPGWSTLFTTSYRTQPNDAGHWWQQTMTAHAWESVTVPAGHFTALRFTNLINFRDPDESRRDSVRKETVWFVPEIGRWVVRESGGTYYLLNSYDDTEAAESSYRWELVSYT